MSKYITEKTLRTIQIRHALTEHQESRRLWIELACKITFMFNLYCVMRNTGAASSVDMPVKEFEEFLLYANLSLGTKMSLSDFYDDPDKNADEAIIYYKTYKKLLKVFDGKVFKAKVAEKLFPELYDDSLEDSASIIINPYFSKISEFILDYMCERISYDTFMQKVLTLKIVPNQKPIDGFTLKKMIGTGEKWVSSYMKIYREEKAKGNV